MSDEAALLKAIIAHPDEDTPRLALADWLEEHGRPDRAALVRVQCAYTAASPAERDYPDLQEELWLCRARCDPLLRAEQPALPAGLEFATPLQEDVYRRGFAHSARGTWHSAAREPTDDEIERVIQALPALAETTVRKIALPWITPAQLARVLAAPGAEHLDGLVVGPLPRHHGDEIAHVLASAATIRRLQQLYLHCMVGETGARALARCKFDRLEYFDLPGFDCDPTALADLLGAKWFRALMQIRCHGSARHNLAALLAAFAQMPRLEHLVLNLADRPLPNTFPGPDGFRELAQLFLTGPFATRAAPWLAKARMPRLIELRLQGLTNNAFRALRRARWFKQLWMLLLNKCALNDASVVALAPALAELRILQIGDNPFGRAGLLALADGARLPSLTTLNLNSTQIPSVPAADVAAFVAALDRPRLRNLWVANWPLGADGAKALASNPSLANVTSLSVSGCGIGEAGFDALVRSPHLQNLVELDASRNDLRKATALRDPKFMPRLRRCWLWHNRFSAAGAAKLARSRNWYVGFANE